MSHYFAVSHCHLSEKESFEAVNSANVENEHVFIDNSDIRTCETSSATSNRGHFISKPRKGFISRLNYIVRRMIHSKTLEYLQNI